MPRVIELFPVPFSRSVSGKWVGARYLAERHELDQRYREWEITGPPEIRTVPDDPLVLRASHVARSADGGSS